MIKEDFNYSACAFIDNGQMLLFNFVISVDKGDSYESTYGNESIREEIKQFEREFSY